MEALSALVRQRQDLAETKQRERTSLVRGYGGNSQEVGAGDKKKQRMERSWLQLLETSIEWRKTWLNKRKPECL
ncbi:hypothetical protein YC2023_106842 [Brassica napus]